MLVGLTDIHRVARLNRSRHNFHAFSPFRFMAPTLARTLVRTPALPLCGLFSSCGTLSYIVFRLRRQPGLHRPSIPTVSTSGQGTGSINKSEGN